MIDHEQAVAPAEEKKLVGLEIVEKDLDIVNGELVGKGAVKHVGKIGWFKLSLEGGVSALPFINKGIDWIEEKIPGDQKIYAQALKDAVAKIKF